MNRRQDRHVLVLVQNAPIERDTRVQRLVASLQQASLPVEVICPANADDAPFQAEGVRVHRFRQARERAGIAGFVVEYAWSLVAMTALAARVATRVRIGVVHVCNPPDFLFLAALPARVRRARLLFDHHDPAPEMYESRFGRRDRLHRLLLGLERWSVRHADAVVSTNEVLADTVAARTGRPRSDFTIVRNAPVLDEGLVAELLARRPQDGSPPTIVWAGHMGPDDGVDIAIRAFELVRRVHPDARLLLIGDGEARGELERLAASLGVAPSVEWTGWIDSDAVLERLTSATVAICSDPSTPRSELSAMIKLTEYLALRVPVVAFPLRTSVETAGAAALFVPESVDDLAAGVEALVRDPGRRADLAEAGLRRMQSGLGWEVQAARYVALVRSLLA